MYVVYYIVFNPNLILLNTLWADIWLQAIKVMITIKLNIKHCVNYMLLEIIVLRIAHIVL